MSLATWIQRLRDRPISDAERRAAFSAATIVLIAAVLLAAMTSTGVPASQEAREPQRATSTVAPVRRGAPPVGALLAAREFLDGYLAFLYGRGSATAVRDTTSSFAAALRTHARTVPPALRRLHPRLVGLSATSSSDGAIVIRALVKDSEVVEYPIRVVLAVRGDKYLVTGLVGA